jgi:predicted DNA binding CopG/RHH family protein
MINLDKEEKELLKSVESGEWKSVPDLKEEINRSKQYAKNTFKKDKRLNIRISKRDLDALKIKALEHGMPYQTLVSSILHKYTTGHLIETE